MKCSSYILLLSVIIGFGNCKKSDQRPAPVNCNGLVTDTAGTGDTARIFVTNVFSPNSNGVNDVWHPAYFFNGSIAAIDVKVYDEQNNIVFNTQTFADEWNPSAPSNTYKKYYYRIQATTRINHKIGLCGDLYLANCLPATADMGLYRFESQLKQNGFDYILPSGESPGTCN